MIFFAPFAETNDELIDNMKRFAGLLKKPINEEAMRAIPRGAFVPPEQLAEAYVDAPIHSSRLNFNISAPHMSANLPFITRTSENQHGSVVGLEVKADIYHFGETNLSRFREEHPDIAAKMAPISLELRNVFLPDPRRRRFDRVYVSATCPASRRMALLDLVNPGGLMLVPIGQSLLLFSRSLSGNEVTISQVTEARFGPLVLPTEQEERLAQEALGPPASPQPPPAIVAQAATPSHPASPTASPSALSVEAVPPSSSSAPPADTGEEAPPGERVETPPRPPSSTLPPPPDAGSIPIPLLEQGGPTSTTGTEVTAQPSPALPAREAKPEKPPAPAALPAPASTSAAAPALASLDALSCPICLEMLSDPVVLSCGHNLCLSCAQKLIDQAASPSKPSNEVEAVECPMCRAKTFLSAAAKKGDKTMAAANGLVRNSALRAVLQEVSSMQGVSAPCEDANPVCGHCCQRPSVLFCTACRESYCSECFSTFHRGRLLAHVAKPLALPQCAVHRLPLTHNCSVCFAPLCAECLRRGHTHAAHLVLPAETVPTVGSDSTTPMDTESEAGSQGGKDEGAFVPTLEHPFVQRLLSASRGRVDMWRELCERVRGRRDELQRSAAIATAHMRQTIAIAIATLQQKEGELAEAIRTRSEGALTQLDAYQRRVERSLASAHRLHRQLQAACTPALVASAADALRNRTEQQGACPALPRFVVRPSSDSLVGHAASLRLLSEGDSEAETPQRVG